MPFHNSLWNDMIPSRPMALELNHPHCIIHAWSMQLLQDDERWACEVSVKGDLNCHLIVYRLQPESPRQTVECLRVWPSLKVLTEQAREAMTDAGVPPAVIEGMYEALPAFAHEFEAKYMADEWDHIEEDLIMLPYEDDEASWR